MFTDHKSLLLLINVQDLNNSSLRCERLLMILGRYKVIVEHVLERFFIVEDTQREMDNSIVKVMESYINSIVKTRPLSDRKL